MTLERIEALLKQRMGLDAASIGSGAVERAVRERVNAGIAANPEKYLERLSASPDEVQQLIELMVVPETWFFRDPEAFGALVAAAMATSQIVRVLSLPCSTGEEAYSMAMALLDAGIAPERFRIDAVDISERALAQARAAHYTRNAFRARELSFRDRYFEATATGHVLKQAVREQVRFHQGNLFAPQSMQLEPAYEAIFCRNLLIYFDRDTQERAIRTLSALLAPGGTICVGPAEAGLLLTNEFESAQLPLAFAFRKRLRPAQAARAQPVRRVVLPSLPKPAAVAVPPANVPKAASPAMADVAAESLAAARRLADAGQTADAFRQCETHLKKHGASADVFYLLGLLHDATGQSETARTHYRKALYLQPDHQEALVQLAMLTDRDNDATGARRLLGRAARAAGKDKNR